MNSSEEEKDYENFEEYMSTNHNSCGRVINHKYDNFNIIYLFQDDSQPPNLRWVSGESTLTKKENNAIAQYWEMLHNNEICGLPTRPAEQVKIFNFMDMKTANGKPRVGYTIISPNLPFEFFGKRDFEYGLTGENTKFMPIDFYESNLIF